MISGDILENLVFSESPNKVALVKRDGYTVMQISLGKGATIPAHVAGHSAFFLVLKGRAIITSGDKDVELAQNQFITMEADQQRGIQALEDSVILGVRN